MLLTHSVERDRAKRLVGGFGLMLALALAPLNGAAQDDQKYGFVNIAKVITQSDEGQVEAQELQSLGSGKEQELNARREKLEKMATEYQESVESGEPDTDLRERIKTTKRELERDLRQARSDVDVARQDRIQEIGSKVVELVRQFAADNGYTAIFRIDGGQMVYVEPEAEITDRIIAAYNEAHPVD